MTESSHPAVVPRERTGPDGIARPSAAGNRYDGQRTARGVVVVCSPEEGHPPDGHEAVTRRWIGERIAALKGCAFAGEHDPSRRYPGPVYFVPADTLIGIGAAEAMGIRGEHDLFGAVVPYPFVATKAITHPAIAADAELPAGWSWEFGEHVREAVLPGYSAFALADARRAGLRLLERGPVRIKPVRAVGGRGQAVVRDSTALGSAIARMDPSELARYGVAIEENLTEVTTYSVGQLHVDGLVATYVGTQRLTQDNGGATVYGGSDLLVVRGGFDALLALDLAAPVRRAITQARIYDSAAMKCFPAMFASRRNYDVAGGLDSSGRRVSGVLEQSWRIGGATGAEIAALERFKADPARNSVRAACVELYGEDRHAPPSATVYFRGNDERCGALTKFTLVDPP